MKSEWTIAERFNMLEMLGQGGMGTVYRALDLQTNQLVAVKALKAEIVREDPTLVERFVREGEALRMLNHPSIVKMLAAVEDDDEHFLVMEYVSGGSLQDLLRQQPQLPIERVLQIALDLSDALTRAHRLKIIHRDLKPANVLIAEDGTPRLTDFGVAQMGDRSRVTHSGSLVGTYAYLSPEVLTGDQLDARTDIWAFGIMLYEMLTGRRPFEETIPAALLTSILSKPLPNIRELRPDAPEQLVELVEHMLVKDRNERINSVRLVGAQLEALISGDTSQIPINLPRLPDSPADDASRFATPTPNTSASVTASFVPPATNFAGSTPSPATFANIAAAAPPARRSMALPAIIAAITVIAVVALAFLLSRPGAESTAPLPTVEPVAASEFMVMVADVERISGDEREITRFIVDDLTQILEVDVPFSNVRVRHYDGVITSDQQAVTVAEANGATVIVWGNYTADAITLEVQIGTISAFSHIEFERDLLERNLNVRLAMTDPRRQSVAPVTLGVLNGLQIADGNAYQAIRSLAILDTLEVTPSEIVGNSIAAHMHRGFSSYVSDSQAAVDEFTAVIEQDAANPIAYVVRASAYLGQGIDQFPNVRRDIQTAQRLSPDSWVMPLYILGNAEQVEGNYPEAIALFDNVVELRPDEWFPWNFRAALRYIIGDYEGAKSDYARAFELGPDANFPYPFSVLLALREGRVTDARELVNEMVTRFPDPTFANRTIAATFGETPSIFGPAFAAFGYLLLGQYELALENVDDALILLPESADLYLAQGFAYCNQQDLAAAEAAYTRAIELDPTFSVLYIVRADVRRRGNDLMGALNDVTTAQGMNLSDELETLITAGLANELSCENFFDL